MKKLTTLMLASAIELFFQLCAGLPIAFAQPLAACGTHKLHIETINVPDSWPEHAVNEDHLYLWNQYMDIYRYGKTTTKWGKNNKNEFGGYPTSSALHSKWGFNWPSGALAMTLTKRSWWPPWENCREIKESDIVFNPKFNWTLDRDNAEDNPSLIFYDSVLLHELGHSWGMLSFLEYYYYPAPTVMHAYYSGIVQDSMSIHTPDAIAVREAYADQESIPTIINVGVHSKFADAEHQIWEISTTDKTSYAVGESITIDNLTVENTGTVDLSNVHIRIYLSTDRHNISNPNGLVGDWSWDTFPHETYGVYSFTGSVPSGIPGGNYYVLPVVTYNGYVDDGWWDNVTHLVNQVVVRAPSAYTLTVNINPQGAGSVSLNPGGGNYPPGSQVTLTATPNPGYTFSSWSGDASGSTNPTTITMNGNKSVTANFTVIPPCSYTLSVNIIPLTYAPPAPGTVTINPQKNTYCAGDQVTLKATPNSGWTFSSWSGGASGSANPTTITMNGNKSVTANFTVIPPCTCTLSPTSRSHGAGAEAGSVSVSAPSGCNWTAASNVNWITITSSSTGTGNGTVYYSVSANSGSGSRTGTLIIGGQAFTVIQSGPSSRWTSVNLPSVSSDWSLLRMHSLTANEGWAVGQDNANGKGVLLHYSGSSWSSMSLPSVSSDWDLQGIHFTSANEGWAVGSDTANHRAVLLHYSGGTWTSVSPPTLSSLWYLCGVHFTSPNEGWAVGGDTANTRGSLLHYSGGTWTVVTPPFVSSNWYLREVYFTSSIEGWAVGANRTDGKGVLLHYSGGAWSSVSPPSVSSDWWLLGLHFTSPSEGWAVGHDETTGRGVLLHYSGGTWSSVSPPYLSSHWWARGVYLTSPNEGWAAGGESTNNSGVMLRYSGGAWTLESLPSVSSDWEIWGTHAASSNEAWAVGIDDSNKKGVLLHYTPSL
jgi:uncharacterized repeat protein (TIGR02543 family)